MQLLPAFIASLTTLSIVAASNIPVLDIDLQKDAAQYDACVVAGSDTFAGIHYGSGPPETVAYNQCVTWRKDGEVITNAVFCRSATCYVFSNMECTTGPSTPSTVIVKAPQIIHNYADFVELLGQSAYCSPNGLDTLIA